MVEKRGKNHEVETDHDFGGTRVTTFSRCPCGETESLRGLDEKDTKRKTMASSWYGGLSRGRGGLSGGGGGLLLFLLRPRGLLGGGGGDVSLVKTLLMLAILAVFFGQTLKMNAHAQRTNDP